MLKKYKDQLTPLNVQQLKDTKGGYENAIMSPIACDSDEGCFYTCGSTPDPRGFKCINHTCRSVQC